MRRFFIDPSDVSSSKTVIRGSDARHIRNVLRLKPGDTISLFDGTGAEYTAGITVYSGKGVEVSISEKTSAMREPPVDITIAQAFLKEKKMDGLVRQLTELGIFRYIPFFAARSVPRPDPKRLAARRERWEKIAREALKQCQRGRPPEICEPVSLAAMLDCAEASQLKILFWENGSTPLGDIIEHHAPPRVRRIFLLLGPEGGFADDEVEKAQGRGFFAATLGPRILRAETATVAACTLLQYLLGDLGKSKEVHHD